MADKSEIKEGLESLMDAILQYDIEASKSAAQALVDKGVEPMFVIKEVMVGAADTLHEKFERGECFLPHLVMAGDAMTAASEILEAAIPKGTLPEKKVVVIATVEGDLHSVGKNIVALILKSGGFEVHDLGVDVKSSAIIKRAVETDADVIALSCLMTTTRPFQREVIEELDSMKLRNKFKVIVGGGPITPEWAKEIGADGYGFDALEALEVSKKLCGISS
jgi:methylmalonyl-CoA mutase cobalamin-binding domain/chain